MTAEAALMKLSYVLGKEDWSLEKKRKVLELGLRSLLHVVDHIVSVTVEQEKAIYKGRAALQLCSQTDRQTVH